jgi:septal ring factor EnvC (AmiA/AmiB activator)
MNPRMVEGLAAPVKEVAERALETEERVSQLEKQFGHGTEDMNVFSRRLKKGPKELRAVRRDSGLQPAQVVEFQNELKNIRKDTKKLEDESKMSKDHML